MIKLAVALLMVMFLSGAAYGSFNRSTTKEDYPRDRVVKRVIMRERPVYIGKKPSKHEGWQWRKKDRKEERGRDYER